MGRLATSSPRSRATTVPTPNLAEALEGIGEVDGPTAVQQHLAGDLTGADD